MHPVVMVVTNPALIMLSLEDSDDASVMPASDSFVSRNDRRPNPLEPAHVDWPTPFLALASDAQELHTFVDRSPIVSVHQFSHLLS